MSVTVSSIQRPLKVGSKDALLCQAKTLARHFHMLSHASTQLDFTSASTVITQTVKNKPQTLRVCVCVCVCVWQCKRADLLMLIELYNLLRFLPLITLKALSLHIYSGVFVGSLLFRKCLSDKHNSKIEKVFFSISYRGCYIPKSMKKFTTLMARLQLPKNMTKAEHLQGEKRRTNKICFSSFFSDWSNAFHCTKILIFYCYQN